jgi:hypothetical protein
MTLPDMVGLYDLPHISRTGQVQIAVVAFVCRPIDPAMLCKS